MVESVGAFEMVGLLILWDIDRGGGVDVWKVTKKPNSVQFCLLCQSIKQSRTTLPPKKDSSHSIALRWPELQSYNSLLNLKIIKKTLTKSCSSWLYASFDTFWVQIDRLV